MTNKKSFYFQAKVFRAARLEAGLTQGQLAAAAGVHSQFVSNWERALCGVPQANLKRVLRKLRIPRTWFHNALRNDAMSEVNRDVEAIYGKRESL